MDESSILSIFGRSPAGQAEPIRTLEEWFSHAPPKGGRKQWVPLRSAYQLAEAWCGTGAAVAPIEFLRMLTDHPLLNDLALLEGWAEHKTDLRGEQRGPRVHDL